MTAHAPSVDDRRSGVGQRVDVGVLPRTPDDGRFWREVCLHQCVVAIVGGTHPLAGVRRIACQEAYRLVFRTQHSSTKRVVDDAFRKAGLEPTLAIVLDTRDGVFETVINDLGIGFT